MDKLYIRKGRRFVAIPNVVGMFYDGVNFTKEKTSKSYAFCYDQNGNTAMLTILNAEYGTFSWYMAKARCVEPYHLPSREQILLARKRYRSLFSNDMIIWTCDVDENYSSRAWLLYWDSGRVGTYYKANAEKVLLFFETEII